MNAQNSKWYLRVAPDEVLSDPCNLKAQFHLNLARIDQGSVRWQSKLTPLEDEMERTLAALVGAPYAARKVTFHLPDFIQVVFNAGDDRQPVGATAGESLPNWGKVETEGRGRTVAMTNIGSDPDSKAVSKKRVDSLFDADSAKVWTPDGRAGAARDDPPRGDAQPRADLHVRVPGQEGRRRLRRRPRVDARGAEGRDRRDVLARLAGQEGRRHGRARRSRRTRRGSRGVCGTSRPACTRGWRTSRTRSSRRSRWGSSSTRARSPSTRPRRRRTATDKGAFTMHFDKLPAAFEKLMKVVATLKAKNDKPAADALVAKYVDGTVVPMKLITERELRFPQTTYVYAVDR